MYYIAVAFTLFALLGGMHLLAKTRKEMLGNFFTWISYIIIAISVLLLICQATQGVIRMACHRGEYSECCMMPGRMGEREHCERMGSGKCCEEMDEDKGHKNGRCEEMMHEWSKEHEKTEAPQDTIKQ